jgi:Flp pilus assembly pilin Flp
MMCGGGVWPRLSARHIWEDPVEHWRIQDRGATAVEYAIMISLVAAVIMATVAVVGGQTAQLFATACNRLAAATGAVACVGE